MRARRWLLWGVAILALIIVLVVAGTWAYVAVSGRPMPEATAALQSDDKVRVTTDPWLVFEPTHDARPVGFIFYPGGLVHPEAYAPAMRALAEQGYTSVIVPMPLNLAVTAPDRAKDVIAAYPEIPRWVIGGHSLGGAMAARFALNNPDLVQGLVLWAAYPADTDSLAAHNLAVTSISGTLDGLATPAKIEASKALLPANTRYVPIEGANHAQFGWYGPQRGDNPATISREEQHAAAVAATAELLGSVATRAP
ncbi:MAG: alpha/beta hydrolase [Anaerolineae bacterium]